MIVPMSRIMLLCPADSAESTLEVVRDLGVVHVRHAVTPRGEALNQEKSALKRVHRVLDAIPRTHGARPSGVAEVDVVHQVLETLRQRRDLEEELEGLKAERERVRPFGGFDPSDVATLAEKGVIVSLYEIARKRAVTTPEGFVRIDLGADRAHRYFALIGQAEARVDATAVRMPEQSLADLEARVERTQQAVETCRDRLSRHTGDVRVLEALARKHEDRIRFLETLSGMAGDGHSVSCLQGFCPEDSVSKLEAVAADLRLGLMVTDAAAEEKVPTLVRNPRWVNVIKPVFDFIGISPGYEEVDISMLFLLFFSLFFGMIVGDAGYGLVFLGLTLGLRKTFRRASPQLVPMMTVMSACTIVWGLLTGNFFGMSRLPALLDAAKVEWLTDHHNIMLFCFLIGAVHLTIAHGWSLLRLRNSTLALAQLGWVCNTWVMFFVACGLVLGRPFPGFLLPLFLVGIALIALFMTPMKRLKHEAFNHVLLPLELIRNFVDIVSYIRLFAVGSATYAVANAFNGMAIGEGIRSLGAGIIAALVLFVGHAFNIVMAAMGVLVHGIRLNTLEFSGHLGVQWTGENYAPFARATRREPPT